MKDTTWHIHVHQPITIHGDSENAATLDPGEYAMREVDLVFYEIGDRRDPKGRLRLSYVLKLRGSGAISIDGAFP